MEENDNNKVHKFGTFADLIQHQIQLMRARRLREAMGYQHENNAPGITPAPRPRKKSKAEIRLQSQELQKVKAKLIAADIIKDGEWQGTPAEFGCLVAELQDERGINNHGRRAWKECAKWAGYKDNIKSARNAIEQHRDTEGPTADDIRNICKR